MSLEPLKISFAYVLNKSKRKTISISIDPIKGVIVKAPLGYKESSILAILKKHEQKIEGLLEKQKNVVQKFLDEGKFMYLGEICSNNHENFNRLEEWLKAEASRVIGERVAEISKQMDVAPQKITFRSQKTRWGSCSSNGNISLNWKLIFAPLGVIDYVIIHELCHLTHLNHSSVFWKLVSFYDPNYKMHRDWLKKHSHLIHWPYLKN